MSITWSGSQRLSATIVGILVGVIAVGIAVDYVDVTRKEKLLSAAVAECGGRTGSIPFWPLGTEYRVTLNSIPDENQLRALAIANQMRGWVGICFKDCEIDQDVRKGLQIALPDCHLFVLEDGRMVPMVKTLLYAGEPSDARETSAQPIVNPESSRSS